MTVGDGLKDEVSCDNCASPLEALDEWRRQCEEAEQDAVTPAYEDGDQGAEGELAIQAIQPGRVNLHGNFSGTATTSTHELELAVDLNLEMPSGVAADAMSQLDARTLFSPFADPRMFPVQIEQHAPRGSIFKSLANLFRRDSQLAQSEPPRAALEAGEGFPPTPTKSRAGEMLDTFVDELTETRSRVSTLESDNDKLMGNLEANKEQILDLQSKVTDLTEKTAEKENQAAAMRREKQELSAHIHALKLQGELSNQTGKDLNKQLADREEDVRSLLEGLDSKTREVETLKSKCLQFDSVKEREQTLSESLRQQLEVVIADSGKMKSDMAKMKALLTQEEAAREPLEQALADTRSQMREMMAHHEAQLAELDTENQTLKDAQPDMGVLAAQAEALRSAQAEVTALTAQRETLKTALDAKQALNDKTQEGSAAGNVVENVAGRSKKNTNELSKYQDKVKSLTKEMQAARSRMDEMETQIKASEAKAANATVNSAAAETAKARSAAQLSHAKEEASKMRNECESLRAKVDSVFAENATLKANIKRLEAEVRCAEQVGTEAREELAEMSALRARTDGELTRESTNREKLKQQLDKSTQEAATLDERLKSAQRERDEVRREMREMQQDSLSEHAKVLEELHQVRQGAAEVQNLQDEIINLKRKCSNLDCQLSVQRAAAAALVDQRAAMAPSQTTSLQDGNSPCLIRSMNSLGGGSTNLSIDGCQASMSIPVPVPSSPGAKIGKIRHIGTTIHTPGRTGSFVSTAPPSGSVSCTPSAPVSPTNSAKQPFCFGPGPGVAGPISSTLSAFGGFFPGQPVISHVNTPAGPVRSAVTVRVVNARRIRR